MEHVGDEFPMGNDHDVCTRTTVIGICRCKDITSDKPSEKFDIDGATKCVQLQITNIDSTAVIITLSC